MTTVSQIVTDAYQAENLIAVNAIPTAAEQDKGVRTLNRIFRSMLGNEIGEKLYSINLGVNNIDGRVASSVNPLYVMEGLSVYPQNYAARNTRLVLNLTAATTIYMPPLPKDGARFAVIDNSANLNIYNLTILGNGNTFDTQTTKVLNTASLQSEWFFREDTGNWQLISNLTLLDNFPLPSEFEEFFIYLLAMRLTAGQGTSLDSQGSFIIKDMMRKIRARYRQTVEVPTERGLYALPSSYLSQGFGAWRSFNVA